MKGGFALDSKPCLSEPIATTDCVVLRLRFSRGEPAIWLAHLDLMRTFERSIRRAGLPVAYSQGFNPRPHLAFALPIGVGLATCDDYVDISLTEPVTPADLTCRLNRFLPAGLAILAAAPVIGAGKSLMSKICAADYILAGPGLAAAARCLAAMPENEPWPVEKTGKDSRVTLDIRPLLLNMQLDSPDQLTIRVRAGSKENLRPDLFLAALVAHGGLDAVAAGNTAITRARLLIMSDTDPAILQSPLPMPDEC
jgi:radical SAM-linked protein